MELLSSPYCIGRYETRVVILNILSKFAWIPHLQMKLSYLLNNQPPRSKPSTFVLNYTRPCPQAFWTLSLLLFVWWKEKKCMLSVGYGDVALFKGVKCENFDPLFFTLINHIWIGDLGTGNFVCWFWRGRLIFAIWYFLHMLSVRWKNVYACWMCAKKCATRGACD